MHRASSIVGEVKGQGQGRTKGQIHLIGYNFASNCHRDLAPSVILFYFFIFYLFIYFLFVPTITLESLNQSEPNFGT